MKKRTWVKHRPLFTSPVLKNSRRTKVRWRVLPILWFALKRTCMVIGVMVLVSSLIGLFVAGTAIQKKAPPLPSEMVLYMELDQGFVEVPERAGFTDPFASQKMTLHRFVDALDMAALDPRVKGLFVRLEGGAYQLSHVQEIRQAIQRFKAAGKFTNIYALSYGETSGLGGYYLASVFDEIWLQPIGVVSIPGVNAEMPFARGALDKIGVTPNFLKRKEYKSAYETFTNERASEENKEMMQALIGDLRAQISSEIAMDMEIPVAGVEALVDRGLFTAQEAYEAGLVDNIDYVDVLVDQIKYKIAGSADIDNSLFVPLKNYLMQKERKNSVPEKATGGVQVKIALVHAVGTIMPDSAEVKAPMMMFGGAIAPADEIAGAIVEATESDDYQAIVLRIDSPGGSPSASERILRAIQRAKEAGKPVIVSMGPLAASGGYWVASGADTIFAMPSTLTGSIGVVGGKFVLQDLWKKIGVNWDAVRWGDNAALWSANTPFSKEEQERVDAMLDQVYNGFINRVAQGRGMLHEDVELIARGRVWSGQGAFENGLVDRIGSLSDALDYTAGLLKVDSRRSLDIETLPRPQTPFEQILELIENQGSVYEGLRIQQGFFRSISTILNGGSVGSNAAVLSYETVRIQ